MKNWYVVHTQASLENKVKESIESAVRAEGLGERISQVLIPTEEVVEIRDGKRTVSTQKMFPNYVIVEMVYDDETWSFIKEIPGVTGFVGPGRRPMPLSETEVQNIMTHINSTDEKPRPKIMFETGESVKVIDGPFFNFTGYVADINEERGRLKVMVDILGRSTPVELDFLQVEKITEEE